MPTDIKVKDAMVSPAVTTTADVTIFAAAKIMKNKDIGSLVIVKGNDKKPVGIVTREDIIDKVTAKDLQPSKILVKDIMSTGLITVNPDDDIIVAAKEMAKYGFERLPVVNMGKLVGILSTREVAKIAPAAIEVLRERLMLEEPEETDNKEAEGETTAGECEICGNYSDTLHNVNDRWVCDNDKEEAAEL